MQSKQHTTLKWTGLAIAAVFCGLEAGAADLKIGVFDLQKAVTGTTAGKKALEDFEKENAKKNGEFEKEQAAIQTAAMEFQKKAGVMSDKKKAEETAKLQERAFKLQEGAKKFVMEQERKKQELLGPMVKRMKEIVKELANKGSYTIVIDRNENIVHFAQEKDDLTQQVVEAYNKKPTT
jgi:outer membrane protein